MLKQRFLTALLLIPLILWGIFKLSVISYWLIISLFILLAGWEWARLSGIRSLVGKTIFCSLLLAIISSTHFTLTKLIILKLALVAPIWWLIALVSLLHFSKYQKHVSTPWILCLIGILVLIPCWLNLNILRYIDPRPYVLLYFFSIIWGSDIAAYFVGKAIGQHKLAPMISPNKSWEGVAGAMLATLILALIFINVMHFSGIAAIYMVILSLLTAGFSIVGDLYESILKRVQGLKDSGHILPGHGGIMDRIDALVAGIPIFSLGYIHQDTILQLLR